MKQEYTIELVEEYDNVNFYSIHLEGVKDAATWE